MILVTAYGREEVVEEARRADLDGFLMKPVNASVLLDTLMNAFGLEPDAGSRRDHRKPADSELAAGLEGAHVLLAEDNEINQEVAVSILADVGVKVDVAGNGIVAVDLARRGSYDAVLMDMQMPEMDGYQATGVLRQEFTSQELPVIAMTAHALQGDRERCLEAGMDDYVSKPIDPKQLFGVLRKWIEPRSDRSKPRAPSEGSAAEQPRALVSASTGQTQPSEPPTELPGINLREALSRLGGNERLFKKLVGEFVRQYAEAPQRIRAHITGGDLREAHSFAHALKGVAGNLSATNLFEATRALELLLKEQAQPEAAERSLLELEEPIAVFEKALQQTLSSMRSLIEPGEIELDSTGASSAAGEPSALDPQTASQLAADIRAAVEGGDLTALQDLLSKVPVDSAVRQRMQELVDQYDFEGLSGLAGGLAREQS
jgi:CheY-like chemotaxis protein